LWGGCHVTPALADTRSNSATIRCMDSTQGIRLVEAEQADLHLEISNQSFRDDPVGLTVEIDGSQVLTGSFEVRNQHHRVRFPVRIPPGAHTLSVVSDTGASLRQPFRMPEIGRRYAAIEYWNAAEDERHITWYLSARPLGMK